MRSERFSPPESARGAGATSTKPPAASKTTRRGGRQAAPLQFKPPAAVMQDDASASSEEPSSEPKEPHTAPDEPPSAPRGDAPPRAAEERERAPIIATGTTLERWQQLIGAVGGPLAATFAIGRLVRWQDDHVELGYEPSSFELPRAQDRDRREEFAAQCAAKLGRELTISVRALTDEELASPELANLSVIEANERERAKRVEALREEATDHPVTRTLVEQFGAKIMHIKTEADGYRS